MHNDRIIACTYDPESQIMEVRVAKLGVGAKDISAAGNTTPIDVIELSSTTFPNCPAPFECGLLPPLSSLSSNIALIYLNVKGSITPTPQVPSLLFTRTILLRTSELTPCHRTAIILLPDILLTDISLQSHPTALSTRSGGGVGFDHLLNGPFNAIRVNFKHLNARKLHPTGVGEVDEIREPNAGAVSTEWACGKFDLSELSFNVLDFSPTTGLLLYQGYEEEPNSPMMRRVLHFD